MDCCVFKKYFDEDCEMCKQVLEDDYESFFVQVQNFVVFTKERFIIVAIE